MNAATSWAVEAIGRVGTVDVEVLHAAGVRILSIDAPGWSLDFRLPHEGISGLATFLRSHVGRAEFAKYQAGSFLGHPVWLIQDGEFADRLWLRVTGEGEVADLSLVGEATMWFASAVL